MKISLYIKVTDYSCMRHGMCYRRLQVRLKVTYELHMGRTWVIPVGHERIACGSLVGLYKWVIYESHVGYPFEYNISNLFFFKLTLSLTLSTLPHFRYEK